MLLLGAAVYNTVRRTRCEGAECLPSLPAGLLLLSAPPRAQQRTRHGRRGARSGGRRAWRRLASRPGRRPRRRGRGLDGAWSRWAVLRAHVMWEWWCCLLWGVRVCMQQPQLSFPKGQLQLQPSKDINLQICMRTTNHCNPTARRRLTGITSLEWACHCINRAPLLRARVEGLRQRLPWLLAVAAGGARSEAARARAPGPRGWLHGVSQLAAGGRSAAERGAF